MKEADTVEDRRIKVFVNTNLNWSRGKMAAHVAHAVLEASGLHPHVPIVVLGAKPRDITELRTVIHDEGRTELEPGTLTAGTDYVFPRQQALDELDAIIADIQDPALAARMTAAVNTLRGR